MRRPSLALTASLTLAALAAFSCSGTPAPATAAPTVAPPATSAPVPTSPPPTRPADAPSASPSATTAPAAPRLYGYKVVRSFPHDPDAFTEGLVFDGGVLFESTGLNGRSSLRRVELETGRILQNLDLSQQYFGEGIAVYGERIALLTYRTNVGFVYDKASFALLHDFSYPGEGWGLAFDGKRLIMSDGSDTLRFLDAETLRETGRLKVADVGAPVINLNELEFFGGEILANVWMTDRIARISPVTGRVVGWIDLKGLLGAEAAGRRVDVLNGIAYDAAGARLFVTGKLWPRLFQIELTTVP